MATAKAKRKSKAAKAANADAPVILGRVVRILTEGVAPDGPGTLAIALPDGAGGVSLVGVEGRREGVKLVFLENLEAVGQLRIEAGPIVSAEMARRARDLARLAAETRSVLRSVAADYDQLAEVLVLQTLAGVLREPGCPPVAVEVRAGQPAVKWKEAFVEAKGQEAADAILAAARAAAKPVRALVVGDDPS